MSWVKQKATPNLKEANADTMVARPSLNRRFEQKIRDVITARPDDIRDAGNIDISGGERGGYRGLGHGERNAWNCVGNILE